MITRGFAVLAGAIQAPDGLSSLLGSAVAGHKIHFHELDPHTKGHLNFLSALGIEAAVAAAPDERTRVARVGEARRLLMPGEMGETFKAMALGRDWDAPLAGFAHQDLRRML